MLTRHTLGIPGLLGALLLLVWLVGFLVLGMHGIFHVLVPIAGVLILAQGVRRVDSD
jgi:hypothetical protein